jgi:hypothetical protein
VSFIRASALTNTSRPAERVVAFYNKRGTCEQWIRQFPAHAGDAQANQDPMGRWIATGALAESEVRSPTLETTMQIVADRPEAPNAIRTNLGAIFISLELSRSKWLITSLSPEGREKIRSTRCVAAISPASDL